MITALPEIIVQADKTGNFYAVDVVDFEPSAKTKGRLTLMR